MNILIIAPAWIGDMVMSHSLYQTLKQQYPDSAIDVLAPAWCHPLLARMPEIRQAILMPLTHGQFGLTQRWQLGRSLKGCYELAIVLPNSAKSGLIPLFAGIKERRGWKGESRYGLLNDLRTHIEMLPYMVQRYVALAYPKGDQRIQNPLDKILWPALSTSVEQQNAALHKLNLDANHPVIGLCPGAEFGPAKRWPTQHYANIAEKAISDGKQIWIFGSDKDSAIAQEIYTQLSVESQTRCTILCGKTSITDAIDLLSRCQAVVSNDTGLMHIAAAVNTPIIALYGSSSPRYTPPLAQYVRCLHTDIECRPCFKKQCPFNHLRCLTELMPDDVYTALLQLLIDVSVSKD